MTASTFTWTEKTVGTYSLVEINALFAAIATVLNGKLSQQEADTLAVAFNANLQEILNVPYPEDDSALVPLHLLTSGA